MTTLEVQDFTLGSNFLLGKPACLSNKPTNLIIMLDRLNNTCLIIAQNSLCTRQTIKDRSKIESAIWPATPPARFALWGGRLVCRDNCHHGRRSMAMWLNCPRPLTPIRTIYGRITITPFWLRRCVIWTRINVMALKLQHNYLTLRLTQMKCKNWKKVDGFRL